MNILALDTSAAKAAIAIRRSDGEEWSGEIDLHGKIIEGLLPHIHELCDQAELLPTQINHIGVGVGPGSFTGLRTAIATAKAIGFKRECKIVGIPSLLSLATSFIERHDRFAVTMNVGRGEVAIAVVVPDPDMLPAFEEQMTIIKDEQVTTYLESRALTLAVGDARFGLASSPSANRLVDLALRSNDEAAPIYSRPSDAKLPAKALRIWQK